MNELPIKIAAVIPTFNRVNSLGAILPCPQSPSYTHPIITIPIVIVDGSTDGTLEMLSADFPAAVIVRGDGNWWYTRCINEGIKKARQLGCNFILPLNDGLTFPPRYIETIVGDHLAAGPD